jgi:hypothetical protein
LLELVVVVEMALIPVAVVVALEEWYLLGI